MWRGIVGTLLTCVTSSTKVHILTQEALRAASRGTDDRERGIGGGGWEAAERHSDDREYREIQVGMRDSSEAVGYMGKTPCTTSETEVVHSSEKQVHIRGAGTQFTCLLVDQYKY
jgi:hypothetical protein